MTWLMYISWLLGPALEVTLLTFMFRRKLHLAFPRFFSYILFQVVKTGFLFVIYHDFETSYFGGYWTANAVSVLLAVAVMDEILQSLFEEYGGIQNLGSIIFRWACGVLLVLSIVNAFSTQAATADRVVAAVLGFDRSVRVMQCGLVLLLMVLCHLVRHWWQRNVFGIAIGFGVAASVELILVSILMHYGNGLSGIVSFTNSAAYNVATLIWIGYMSRQTHSVPQVTVAPQLNALNLAIVESTGSDVGFVSMVEAAVERVLSRSSWPKPSIKGPHMVGRKPEPEERN